MGFFDRSKEEITQGRIGRVLLILATPILVQNLVHVAQQVIDLFWLGRLSSDGVAAVGLATPVVLFLLTSTITATFVGTHVLVSQRVGGDDETGAQRALFTGLVLTVVLGVGVGGLMYVYVDELLAVFAGLQPGSQSGPVLQLAEAYLKVIALGVVFAGLSDVVEAAFLGWGDSRATLYVNVSTVIANVTLTPIFMFGVGPVEAMGIRGAAIGTVAGYLGGFLLGVVFMYRGSHDLLSRSAVEFDLDEVREQLDIGLPQAVHRSVNTVGQVLLVIVVFSVAGAAGTAAYTVGSRVGSIAFRTASSFSQAAQTVVGMNLGAENPERAVRTVWVGVALSTTLLLVFAAGQFLIPAAITRLVAPTMDGEALELSVAFLQILAIAYPANAVLSLVGAGFNGARRTRTTMVVALAERWGIQIPIAVVAVFLLDYRVTAVFWAETIAVVVAAVGLSGYFAYSTSNGMYSRAMERIE